MAQKPISVLVFRGLAVAGPTLFSVVFAGRASTGAERARTTAFAAAAAVLGAPSLQNRGVVIKANHLFRM